MLRRALRTLPTSKRWFGGGGALWQHSLTITSKQFEEDCNLKNVGSKQFTHPLPRCKWLKHMSYRLTTEARSCGKQQSDGVAEGGGLHPSPATQPTFG